MAYRGEIAERRHPEVAQLGTQLLHRRQRRIDGPPRLWLDRQLLGRNRSSLATGGFGAEVRQALERRAEELVRQGHVSRTPQGQLRIKADLIGTLTHQEVERVGRHLAAERGLAFQPIREGQAVRVKLVGSAQLVSGRFAMIDDGLFQRLKSAFR